MEVFLFSFGVLFLFGVERCFFGVEIELFGRCLIWGRIYNEYCSLDGGHYLSPMVSDD